MMVRVRLYNISAGQIDDVLIEEYRKVHPFNRLVNVANAIISQNILHYNIKSAEDVLLAEQYVKNLRYRNLGEYLTDYMRNAVMNDLKICRNCQAKCSKMENELQSACDNFTTLPQMPEI